MELRDFKNFSTLGNNLTSPFINRKKNNQSEITKISNAVHIQLSSDNLGILKYKTNFKEVNLLRATRRALSLPLDIPVISNSLRPIPKKIYNHLMSLLQWVPESCKSFFRDLVVTDTEDDENLKD